MLQFLRKLYTLPKTILWVIVFSLLFFIGWLDWVTGPEMSVTIFYLFPIFMVSILVDLKAGIITAITAALFWFLAEVLGGREYTNSWILYWNTLVRLIFFLMGSVLAVLKTKFDSEKELARTDVLTGLANRVHFFEIATKLIHERRAPKVPLAMAYIDLDNFKDINDNMGHITGDRLLRKIGKTMTVSIRASDFLARIGGDEFALLLPETTLESALEIMERVRLAVHRVIDKRGWPVTLSIGLVVFYKFPRSINEMMKMADQLMYSAKLDGKNRIHHHVIK